MGKSKWPSGSWMVTVPIVGIAAAYLTLFFLPGRQEIAKLRAELRQKRDFVDATDSLQPVFLQTQRRIDEARRYRDRWHRKAPRLAETPSVYERITARAEAAGVVTAQFQPHDTEELQSLCKIPVTYGISGTFAQIHRAIAHLEQLPETMWLEDLRIEGPRQHGTAVQCVARVVILGTKMDKPDSTGEDRSILPVIWRILIRSSAVASR